MLAEDRSSRTSTARHRGFWLVLSLVALSLLVLAAASCETSTTTVIQPTTGILVRSETLTTGKGCGKDPENVFKYAVVVFGYSQGPIEDRTSYTTPVTANVFDCFTDGAFIELDPVAGSSTFRLEVYAYNEPAYAASRGTIDLAGTDTNALKATGPTWTTQCTATQQTDVQVLALCNPLTAGLGGIGTGQTAGPTRIALATSTFHLPDGRTATCASAGDGGADADATAPIQPAEAGTPTDDAASDASPGDASPVADASAIADAGDAGGTVTFSKARIRYRTGQSVGTTTDVACGNTYIADLPAEPARYDIDVGLLDPSDSPIGTTVCTATTQSGATSSAVCP